MRMPRTTVLLLAGALGTTAALPALSSSPAHLRLDYAGYLVDSEVLYARVDVSLDNEQGPYRMNLSSGLVGTLGQLYQFHLQASSQGKVAAPGPLPVRYTSEISVFEDRQTVLLTYGAHGAVRLTDDPPTEEGQLARARGLLAGTVDPLSAALGIANVVARAGQCSGRLRIFDGARRYDLDLAPAPADLPVPRFSVPVSGLPVACDAAVSLISGFSQSAMDAGMYPKSVQFWLARDVAGPLPALLRAEANTGIGLIRLDLRDILPGS